MWGSGDQTWVVSLVWMRSRLKGKGPRVVVGDSVVKGKHWRVTKTMKEYMMSCHKWCVGVSMLRRTWTTGRAFTCMWVWVCPCMLRRTWTTGRVWVDMRCVGNVWAYGCIGAGISCISRIAWACKYGRGPQCVGVFRRVVARVSMGVICYVWACLGVWWRV